MCIAIKRVYDPVGDDGTRILVDRLWPRGVSKDNLQGEWIKEVAPSTALRKWFDHQPDKWLEFKRKYFAELETRQESVEEIVELVQNGKVTILYSSKNKEYNHAVALREYLQEFIKKVFLNIGGVKMKSVQELVNEHEGIQLMLSILQNVAKKIASGENVPKKEMEGIMEFLTVFVDKCHHGKEEDFLFPALEGAGIAKDGGPIGVMLQEHERGRRHIADMKKALGNFTSSGINAAEFQKAVEEYVSLLNQHIFKENNVLFPMAEKVLSVDDDKKLFDNFEKLEVERIGIGKHEEFHALMDTLADKYR